MRKNEAVWSEKYKHWRIQVQQNGVRRSFYSSIPKKQGKAEAERKADIWLEDGDPDREMTFDELSASYLSHIRTTNGSAHKIREQKTIELYLPFHHRLVSELTNLDYQSAIDACVEDREHPLSVRTCGHIRTTILALYKHARMAGVKMTEPFGLTIPTGATKGTRKILQPEDIQKLFAAAGHYIYIFKFITVTGLRPGEVCGLRWTDLDGDILTINRAKNVKGEITKGKTENANRTIKLPQIAMDCLQPNDSEWMFTNAHGEPLDERALYSAWRRARKKLGIEAVSLYELRHTMISLCKTTVPLPLLKQAVGHSKSMDTIGTYGHEIDGDLQQTADLIQEVFLKVMG